LLARSGLTDKHLEQIRESSAYGPLLSALRGAKARGIDIDDDFRLNFPPPPRLIPTPSWGFGSFWG
ncbi:hypothetical protein, partial [Ferrimicrobium sp.]